MKITFCSWCGKLHNSGSPGTIILGGSSLAVDLPFCRKCVPMVKDLLDEYGPGFFPDGFTEMKRLYDAGQLFKSQKGGDSTG